MAIYSFEDKETGEEFTLSMSNAEREQFLKDNPNVQQILTRMNIGDPVGLGVTRPPEDFQKYVVSKALEQPGAHRPAVERRWNLAKEV